MPAESGSMSNNVLVLTGLGHDRERTEYKGMIGFNVVSMCLGPWTDLPTRQCADLFW